MSLFALGHNRLSIIDLSKRGQQPMCNKDGTVWISFNGEIYNYKQFAKRAEVEASIQDRDRYRSSYSRIRRIWRTIVESS